MRRMNMFLPRGGDEHRATGLLCLVLLAIAGPALGSESSSYSIDWYTMDSGGGTSIGGEYMLTGTVGQPDAGWASGGAYVLAGGFLPGGRVGGPTPMGITTVLGPAGINKEEWALLGEINNYRASSGVGTVVLSSKLSNVAAEWSCRMAEVDTMHHPPDSPTNDTNWMKNHVTAQGYPWDWPYAAEIICGGARCSGETAQEAINSWKGSSGHSDVILQRNSWSGVTWQAAGIGQAYNSSSYKWYWTVVFGPTDDGDNIAAANDGAQPSVSITSPANGSTVSGTVNITASASDSSDIPFVEFYYNPAPYWTDPCSTVYASPFTYTWDTAAYPYASAKWGAKAYDGYGNTNSATIDVNVSNTAQIHVTAPNGGEVWPIGSTQYITWTSVAVTGNVKIELSSDNGSTWEVISSIATNNGSYSWKVAGRATEQGRIRVSSASVSDQSDGNFTIPGVTVTRPNGGEVWPIGYWPAIAWTSAGAGSNVKIELSRDSGSVWEVISSSAANLGAYLWMVAGPVTTRARIRVSSLSSPSLSDQSDSDFTIQAAPTPSITVNSPNGSENWPIGSKQTITWTSVGLSRGAPPPGESWVKIDISRDGGKSWSSITSSTWDIRSYSWTVTGPATAHARIKVTDTVDSGVFDTSDQDFTIY